MAFYPSIPASDGTSMTPPENAEFKVYELFDTARANPLQLVTEAGLNAAPLVTTEQGVVPPVNVVSPTFSHIFKSGEWEWRRDSFDAAEQATRQSAEDAARSAADAAAARRAAEEAAHEAMAPADEAVDKGIERADLPGLVAAQVPAIVAGEPSASGDDATQLNALTSRSGASVSLLPGRTYRLKSGITVGSNTTIDLNGATLDFTQMPPATALGQMKAISAEGSIGPTIEVSALIPQWSRTVTGISSTASLRAGDLVLLSNNERPVSGMTRTVLKKAQLAIIKSVDSPSQVTLTAGAIFQYGAVSLSVQKLTPVENIAIHGGAIKLGGVGSGHNGIHFRFGKNCTVRDVTINGAEDQSVTFSAVYNGKALHNTISDATSNVNLGNTGYGVAVVEASRYVLVQGNQFRNCRHFVAGGGAWPAIQVDILDNQGEHSKDAAYDCHEPCLYWTFRGNTVSGAEGVGFIIRGQHITVENNTVMDSSNTGIRCYTFDGVSEQVGLRIVGNQVVRCAGGIEIDGLNRGGDTVDSVKRNLVVADNSVSDSSFSGILVRHFEGALVTNNRVQGVSTEDGIQCVGISAAKPSTQLTFTGNNTSNVLGAGRSGIKVIDVLYATLDSNAATESANEGITVTRGFDVSISNCRTHRGNFAGLRVDASSRIAITGGIYSDGYAANADGVRVTGSTDITVSGTITKNPRAGINITGSNSVIVTGNNARGNGAGTKIIIDATATSKVEANNMVA